MCSNEKYISYSTSYEDRGDQQQILTAILIVADTEDESGNGDDSDGGASGDNKYNYNDESNRCTKSY